MYEKLYILKYTQIERTYCIPIFLRRYMFMSPPPAPPALHHACVSVRERQEEQVFVRDRKWEKEECSRETGREKQKECSCETDRVFVRDRESVCERQEGCTWETERKFVRGRSVRERQEEPPVQKISWYTKNSDRDKGIDEEMNTEKEKRRERKSRKTHQEQERKHITDKERGL